MFGYLEGKLQDLLPTQTYLDVQGAGYEIQLTLHTFEAIRDKASCKLFIHLQIREDAWTLYGFATEKEREAFRKLLSVSGVGASTARILLSSLTSDDLSKIVLSGDSKALEKVKGIGSKTAQRIILELKGKLPEPTNGELSASPHNTLEQDALNALLGLGIGKAMAEAALKKSRSQLSDEILTVEHLIKTSLKNL
jgi:Holliday junction DNA helicase RuvA